MQQRKQTDQLQKKTGSDLHNHGSSLCPLQPKWLQSQVNCRLLSPYWNNPKNKLNNWMAKMNQSGTCKQTEMSAEDITDSWGAARSKLCGMSIKRCAHGTKTSPACACVHSQCETGENLSTNNLGIQHYECSPWLHIQYLQQPVVNGRSH